MAGAHTRERSRRRSRADDVFEVIRRYAETYPGSTPSQKQIAEELGLSQQRVGYLMMRLELVGKIAWLTRQSYYVPRSAWEPPPDA